MTTCILIRGPAGVGKTSVAGEVARKIHAEYYSVDDVLQTHGLDTIKGDGIPAENFIKADNFIFEKIKSEKVVLDGCFYREEQIQHIRELCQSLYIFTLYADLEECKRRNSQRPNSLPSDAVEDVYWMVKETQHEIPINAKGTKEKVINDVIACL